MTVTQSCKSSQLPTSSGIGLAAHGYRLYVFFMVSDAPSGSAHSGMDEIDLDALMKGQASGSLNWLDGEAAEYCGAC